VKVKLKAKNLKKESKKSEKLEESSGSDVEERRAANIRRNNINICAPRSDRILFNTKSVFSFALEFVDHDLRAETSRAKIVIQDRSKLEEDNTIRSLCYFENNTKFKIIFQRYDESAKQNNLRLCGVS